LNAAAVQTILHGGHAFLVSKEIVPNSEVPDAVFLYGFPLRV